jgi:hypothetical protein
MLKYAFIIAAALAFAPQTFACGTDDCRAGADQVTAAANDKAPADSTAKPAKAKKAGEVKAKKDLSVRERLRIRAEKGEKEIHAQTCNSYSCY